MGLRAVINKFKFKERTKMSREEKLQELLLNESFTGELENLKNAEEVQAVLKNYGVDMTLEEINELGDLCENVLKQMNNDKNDELSEEDLSSVAGGTQRVTDQQMQNLLWGIIKDIGAGCVRDLKKAIFGR